MALPENLRHTKNVDSSRLTALLPMCFSKQGHYTSACIVCAFSVFCTVALVDGPAFGCNLCLALAGEVGSSQVCLSTTLTVGCIYQA